MLVLIRKSRSTYLFANLMRKLHYKFNFVLYYTNKILINIGAKVYLNLAPHFITYLFKSYLPKTVTK